MQAFLFNGENGNGSTVTEHLKSMISSRFDISDIPDAFLYVDEVLGGLNLRNPFVPLFLVRNYLLADPAARMATFHDVEHEDYLREKKQFESMTAHERWRRYREVFPKDDEEADNLPPGYKRDDPQMTRRLKWEDAQEFWSFNQYTEWRESSSRLLYETYQELMALPTKEDIALSDPVVQGWKQLESTNPASVPFSTEAEPAEVDSVAMWTIQYHADELFEKCGGLDVLDTSLLPLGVLKALKSRKVTWQMVL